MTRTRRVLQVSYVLLLLLLLLLGRLAKGIMGKKCLRPREPPFLGKVGRLLKNNYVAFC